MNFDELLKKGKQNVSGTRTEDDTWKDHISMILHIAQQLNDMYSNGNKHNLKLEPKKCSVCSAPTFVLTVRQLKSPHTPMHFHRSSWSYANSKYYCEKCKKV